MTSSVQSQSAVGLNQFFKKEALSKLLTILILGHHFGKIKNED
jgi:hypothetical protein